MDKPNKEFIREWVAALRSSEYRQGTGFLRRADDTYCCLGVACDLLAKRGEGEWKLVVEDTPADAYFFDDRQGVLSQGAAQLIFGYEKPTVGNGPACMIADRPYISLTAANDTGVTFAQIADWLEEKYLG